MLVADNRLKVKTSHQEIGDWELTELYSRIRPDGCHIVAEGEELIVSVEEPMRFVEAIGPSVANPGDGSLLGADTTRDHGIARRAAGAAWDRVVDVPLEWKVVTALGLLGAVLLVVAPPALIGIVLFVALAGLLIGGYSLMDPYMAVQLPDPFTPQILLRGGAAALVLAIALTLIA